jgi:hypothetical protein
VLNYYPETIGKVLGDLTFWTNSSLVERFRGVEPVLSGWYGGCISFLQEPGAKLRAVANPYRFWQQALDPLSQSLYSFVKRLEWDFTYEQYKGIPSIQASLRNGDKWYSVDLQNATDNFPLDLQLKILDIVYSGQPNAIEAVNLFGDVSRMPWWYREDGEVKEVTWTRGQPLGLRPSFASFALAHGLVLLTLNGGKWNRDFFVLGDDVVIKGEELHNKYRQFLDRYQLPVSEAKCLEGQIAEFASILITPDTLIPTRKWRSPSGDNFVDLARLWGPSSFHLFSKREQRVLTKLAKVPPFWGGLGWGDPTTWEYKLPHWLDARKGLPYDTSAVRRYSIQVYSSSFTSDGSLTPKIPEHIPDLPDVSELLASAFGNSFRTADPTIGRAMLSNLGLTLGSIPFPLSYMDGDVPNSLELWEQRLGF